jgi:PAS domain S-box-containing protein
LSVYFRNVTDRKRAQQELRDTKQKIEALHDVAARAVSCTSEQEIYELAIQSAEDILEFDLSVVDRFEDGELVPCAVSKGVPSDGYYDTTPIDTEDNLAARAYRNDESTLVRDVRETDVVPAEHEYRSVLTVPFSELGVFQAVSKEPDAFDEDDRELTELLAAHLTAALSRVQTETELRAERDRFAALFENVPNPVVRYEIDDSEATAKSVNPAFEDVFGWEAEEIVGESVDDYILPEDQLAEGESLNEKVRRGTRIEGVEVHRKTRDDGRDFLLHTAPAGNGDEAEAFAIYVDITEQKERERKLARQNERLEEFASVVSHDLRNPLNVALGRFDLLEQECDSDHFAPIGRSLDRMDSLVEDLLALARQGQVVDETEPVSLSTAASEAWETVDTGEMGLQLEDDLVVEADDARFRELLENLFRNAVEHADSATAVEVGPLDDREGFYVADDGPGIPAEERDRIFDHGFTTAEDGTGFGLAIVASIADAHGWEVEVLDDPDGARFEFSRVSVSESVN